ncbi:MAG: YggT family protein [Endozoicomonadaceae bacterium]|nr:YggT family protein [Endozoicomonadaceae bacterium]
MSPLTSSLLFLVETVGSLFIMAVLIRFLLQLVQADFYNPVSQAIAKITGPLLNPLRRLIPSFKGFDIAALILAFLAQIALVYLLLSIQGYLPSAVPAEQVLAISLFKLLKTVLNIYMFSLIIIAIASWITPPNHNPALMLLNQLTEPLSRRVRKIIPPMGGLDFSLMALLILIVMIKNVLPAIIPGI